MQAKDIPDEAIIALVRSANNDGHWAMVWDIEAAMPDVPPKVIRAKCCSLIRRRLMDGCESMHNCRGDYFLPGTPWWDDEMMSARANNLANTATSPLTFSDIP